MTFACSHTPCRCGVMSPQGPGGDRGVHGLQHLVHQTLLQRSAHSESTSLPGLVERRQRSCIRVVFFFLPEGFRGDRAGSAHSQQVIQPGGDYVGEHGAQIVSFSIWFVLFVVYSALILSRCSLRAAKIGRVRGCGKSWGMLRNAGAEKLLPAAGCGHSYCCFSGRVEKWQ